MEKMKKNILIFALMLCFSFTFVFAQTASPDKKAKKADTKATTKVQETPKTTAEPSSTTVKKTKKADTKATPKAAIKSGKPTVGVVISLLDFATGGSGEVNKAKATELVNKGQPLALKAGTTKKPVIYIVANPDGTIANKKLAELADGKVGVVGKIKKRNGMNVIISDIIEQYK